MKQALGDNALLEGALDYAARGWRVHPLRDGDKRPRLSEWPRLATTDPETIRAWWGRWPEANVGIATGGGLVILDSDGEAAEAALGERELPPTATVQTPRGWHRYFRTDAPLRNTAGAFGEGVDTRAEGGYVVAPPSRTAGGSWQWVLPPDEVPPVAAPRWLSDACGALPGRVSTVRERLERGDPIPVGMRNATLAAIAGAMRRAGLHTDEIAAALQCANARRCVEPLGMAEVERIAVSLGRYERGEVAVAPQIAADRLFVPAAELLAHRFPPVEYLVGSAEAGCVLEARALTILHGKPRSWKSWSALTLAASVATGRSWVGVFPARRARVAFVQEEGGIRNWQRRLALVAGALGASREELEGQLLTAVGQGFRLDEPAWVERLIAELRPFAPELVALDPLAHMHGADENDATQMGSVVRTLRDLGRELRCAVLLVHHDRKGDAPARRAEQLRGSSALWAAGSTVALTRQGSDGASVFVEQKDAGAPEGFVIRFRFGEDTLTVTHDGRSERREVVSLAERVLELLQERGPLTNAEVRESLGCSKPGAYRALSALECQGLVLREGTRERATVYAAS